MADELVERVKMLEAQVDELQDALASMRTVVSENSLWLETGKQHKYCPGCKLYIQVFGRVYVDHPNAGEPGRCPRSLKPWRV